MVKRIRVVCDCCGKDMTEATQRWGQSLQAPDGKPFQFDFCSDGCAAEWRREHLVNRLGVTPMEAQ